MKKSFINLYNIIFKKLNKLYILIELFNIIIIYIFILSLFYNIKILKITNIFY